MMVHFDGNYTLEILVWATSFVPLYGILEQSFGLMHGPYEWLRDLSE